MQHLLRESDPIVLALVRIVRRLEAERAERKRKIRILPTEERAA